MRCTRLKGYVCDLKQVVALIERDTAAASSWGGGCKLVAASAYWKQEPELFMSGEPASSMAKARKVMRLDGQQQDLAWHFSQARTKPWHGNGQKDGQEATK